MIEIIDTYNVFLYNGQMWFCLYSSGWTCVTTVQPPNNTWVHVAGVWNGADMKLFVNGILKVSTTFTGPLNHNGPGDQSLKIGNGWTLIDGFNGFIDMVRVSDVARYDANFSVQNKLEPDGNTVGLWQFDSNDVNTATANDRSSYGNDGAITGAVWVTQ